MYDVILVKANLKNANLIEADFLSDDPDYLVDVELEGAKLDKQVIEQFADLIRIDFNKPIFKLDKINLVRQDLTGANLSNLYLMNVDFSSANISGANFTNSNISGSILRNVIGLTIEMLHSSNSYTNIKLTSELQPILKNAKKAKGNNLITAYGSFKRKANEDREEDEKQLKRRIFEKTI